MNQFLLNFPANKPIFDRGQGKWSDKLKVIIKVIIKLS